MIRDWLRLKVPPSEPDPAPVVAQTDYYQEAEQERKERIAQRERYETEQIKREAESEMASFKANICDVIIVRNIGDTVKIAVKYTNPVSSVSKVIERKSSKPTNDFFKILSALIEKQEEELRSHTFETTISENMFTLKVDVKLGDTFVRMISGGNYDFMDGTSKGYWLNISLEKHDEVLLRILVKACKSLGFVFWSSTNSATGLLQRSNVTIREKVELLEKASKLSAEQLRNAGVKASKSDDHI